MKEFSNIKEALDFATGHQHKLKFPFTCRCNGLPVKVISPAMARTLSRERPNLVVNRTSSDALQLGYIVSLRALIEILQSLATAERDYSLAVHPDHVVVICGVPKAFGEFTFPIVKRVSGLPQDEGTFILMEASGQSNDRKKFWLPLEMRLLHSSINPLG